MKAQDAADEAAATRAVERDQHYFHELAEATVLAALLRASPSLPDDLDTTVFYRDAHRIVADHAIMLRESGREPDQVTLVDDLIEHGKLEAAGGAVYVSKLYEAHPMSTETTAALTIVQRNFYRRRAEEARTRLVSAFARADYEEGERLLGEVKYWEELQAGAAAATRPTRFRFLSVEEIEAMQPARGILGDILYEDCIAFLYGPLGRWKSFIALDWSLCKASGRYWLGRPVKAGYVVYVAAEGARGIKKRVQAWKMRHRHTGPLDFHLVPQPVNLMLPDQVQAFIADIKASGKTPDLIVFDTLARSMVGGNPNDPKDANLVTDSLGQIKAEFGCCVLCVAHPGKEVTRGIVGAYQLSANADIVILVNGKEGEARIEPGEMVKLVNEKPKENEHFDDIWLTAEKVEWVSEAGEPSSSLVIVGGSESGAISSKLASSSRTALLTLTAFPEGVKSTAWCTASGLPKSTFMHTAMPDLLARGLVCRVDGINRLTASGVEYCSGASGASGAKVVPLHRK